MHTYKETVKQYGLKELKGFKGELSTSIRLAEGKRGRLRFMLPVWKLNQSILEQEIASRSKMIKPVANA